MVCIDNICTLEDPRKKKLDELKEQLLHVKGRPTECYSRIVGYYRAVANWNKGKSEEYKFRKEYSLA